MRLLGFARPWQVLRTNTETRSHARVLVHVSLHRTGQVKGNSTQGMLPIVSVLRQSRHTRNLANGPGKSAWPYMDRVVTVARLGVHMHYADCEGRASALHSVHLRCCARHLLRGGAQARLP